MDTEDLGFDVELWDGDVPPLPPEADEPSPRPAASPASSGRTNTHLFTFIVVIFAALELQAILVLMGTAEGGHAEAITWAFGGVFLLSTFLWLFGGMLWFNRKWEQHR
ncbi:MAG: hypothetical protein AB8H79_01505 [Myxococcota bacterium]